MFLHIYGFNSILQFNIFGFFGFEKFENTHLLSTKKPVYQTFLGAIIDFARKVIFFYPKDEKIFFSIKRFFLPQKKY